MEGRRHGVPCGLLSQISRKSVLHTEDIYIDLLHMYIYKRVFALTDSHMQSGGICPSQQEQSALYTVFVILGLPYTIGT